MACDNVGDLFMMMLTKPKDITRVDLLKNLNKKLTVNEIKVLRHKYKIVTLNELKDSFYTEMQVKENNPGPYANVLFANKFFLYKGLAAYYEKNQHTEKAKGALWLHQQHLNLYDRGLFSVFDCKPEFPICLYDFSYKNKCPSYFCLKVEGDLGNNIIDDYFDRSKMKYGGP